MIADVRLLVDRFLSNRRIALNISLFRVKPHEIFLTPYIHVKRNCFVDVGANTGSWSISSARYYSEVWAFEANPTTAGTLERNLRVRRIRNVRVCPIALGERGSTKELWLYSHHSKDSFRITHNSQRTNGKSVLVKVKTLDSFGLRPDLVKIDTEGYEPEVIEGGLDTIRKCKPVLVVETHDAKDVRIIMEKLRGYSWKFVERRPQIFMIGVSSVEVCGVKGASNPPRIGELEFIPESFSH